MSKCLTPNSNTGVFIKISAPGKVILHGEHSVVYGKLALAASLGLRTKLSLTEVPIKENEPQLISIKLPVLNFSQNFDFQLIKKYFVNPTESIQPEFINYELLLKNVDNFVNSFSEINTFTQHQLVSIKSFFLLFSAILGAISIDLQPFDIIVDTDLNVGAGTGSSASYNVCVAAAFLEYIKVKTNCFKNGCKFNSNVDFLKDAELGCFKEDELELISKWAFCAEKIIHGTPSGIDNTVCTFGNMVEFRKGTPPKLVSLSSNFKILLINTKVARETKKLVAKVAQLHQQHPSLTDNILNALEYVSIDAIKNFSAINQNNSKEFYDELGRMAVINHNLLSCLGVSHPKLDEIVAILGDDGFSGKLTGAGGGGYAISLVSPYVCKDAVNGVMGKLTSRGFHVVLADLGGSGVTVD